jgi:hypothetical protein
VGVGPGLGAPAGAGEKGGEPAGPGLGGRLGVGRSVGDLAGRPGGGGAGFLDQVDGDEGVAHGGLLAGLTSLSCLLRMTGGLAADGAAGHRRGVTSDTPCTWGGRSQAHGQQAQRFPLRPSRIVDCLADLVDGVPDRAPQGRSSQNGLA